MPRRLIAALALLLVGVLGVGVTTALSRSGDDDTSPRAGGPSASPSPTDDPLGEPTVAPTAEPTDIPAPSLSPAPGSGTGGAGTGGAGTGGAGTGGAGTGGAGTGGAPTTPNTGDDAGLLLAAVVALVGAAGVRLIARRS